MFHSRQHAQRALLASIATAMAFGFAGCGMQPPGESYILDVPSFGMYRDDEGNERFRPPPSSIDGRPVKAYATVVKRDLAKDRQGYIASATRGLGSFSERWTGKNYMDRFNVQGHHESVNIHFTDADGKPLEFTTGVNEDGSVASRGSMLSLGRLSPVKEGMSQQESERQSFITGADSVRFGEQYELDPEASAEMFRRHQQRNKEIPYNISNAGSILGVQSWGENCQEASAALTDQMKDEFGATRVEKPVQTPLHTELAAMREAAPREQAPAESLPSSVAPESPSAPTMDSVASNSSANPAAGATENSVTFN